MRVITWHECVENRDLYVIFEAEDTSEVSGDFLISMLHITTVVRKSPSGSGNERENGFKSTYPNGVDSSI